MKTISREELKNWLDEKKDFFLVDVLNKENFLEAHIPGSLNISVHSDDFKEKFFQLIPDKDSLVVIYCWKFDCPTSDEAMEVILKMGYTNVIKYSGGVMDWEDAGYDMNRK